MTASSTDLARGPEILTTAMAAGGCPEDRAKIVSCACGCTELL
jgi:hypothetical protein